MNSSLELIQRLVPPPARPVNGSSPTGFVAVEAELGLLLPEDYKALITLYGDGDWQEFWSLLNPFSENQYLNLLLQAPRADSSGNNTLSAERYIKERQDYPHPIWPETGGIFPWAITDNGGRFFWVTAGSPESWPSIYYPSRDPDYESIELPTGAIVAGLLTGDLPLFEAEFGGEVPPCVFSPHDG